MPAELEKPWDEVRVPDVDLNVVHAATLERRGCKRDAFSVSLEPGGTEQLTPGLQAFAPPSGVARLIAQYRPGIAEPERKRPGVQLRRHDARHAHGTLADQREQRAVRVHEPEEPRLLRSADTGRDGVEWLDQRRDDEAVSPQLEGLDESIGEEAAARRRAHQPVGEPVRAPACSRAGWQRVKASHAGILRAGQGFPVLRPFSSAAACSRRRREHDRWRCGLRC